MLNLDFSSVKGFDPIPESENYVFKIEKVEEKAAKTSGSPMLNLTVEVIADEFDGEYVGRKVFENYVLTEKCLWKLKQLLAAIGIDASGAVDLDTQELLGKTFTGSIIIQEYNGNEKNSIKNHKAAPSEFQLI